MFLEKEVRQKVNKTVSRGSVDIFVQVQSSESSSQNVLDLNKAKEFHEKLKKMSTGLKVNLENEVDLILRYGDVFVRPKTSVKADLISLGQIKKIEFLKLVDDLINDFQLERQREGKALQKELSALLMSLEKVRLKLEVLAQDHVVELKEKLDAKVKQWKQEFDLERLNQELLLLVDKSDIKEEVIRLKEHIKACKKLLVSADSRR